MSVPLKNKFPHPLCHNANCICDSTSENIPPYDIQNQDILFPDSIMLQQLSLQAIHGICAFKWFCACCLKSWNAHYIFKLLRVFLRSGDNLKFKSKNTWFWNMTVIWGQNARKLQHNILMNIYEHPPGLPVSHTSSLSMYLCLHGVCVCVCVGKVEAREDHSEPTSCRMTKYAKFKLLRPSSLLWTLTVAHLWSLTIEHFSGSYICTVFIHPFFLT